MTILSLVEWEQLFFSVLKVQFVDDCHADADKSTKNNNDNVDG